MLRILHNGTQPTTFYSVFAACSKWNVGGHGGTVVGEEEEEKEVKGEKEEEEEPSSQQNSD